MHRSMSEVLHPSTCLAFVPASKQVLDSACVHTIRPHASLNTHRSEDDASQKPLLATYASLQVQLWC